MISLLTAYTLQKISQVSGIQWHFDAFFSKAFTHLISHLSFKFSSWSYHGAWFQVWRYHLDLATGLWVIASGILVRSACRGIFRGKTWPSIHRKSQNQWCCLTHDEPESSILTFISWPWMTLITCRPNLSSLIPMIPGAPLISYCYPPKYHAINCMANLKKKRDAFSSNFCIWRP